MELTILLKKLKKEGYEPQIFGKKELLCDLLNIRIFETATTLFNDSTLYLSSTAQLPSPDTSETFVLFCCGSEIDFTCFATCPFTIAYFGNQITQAELFNVSMEFLTEIQQLTAGMHILVNALFSGNGLQYLVDTAAHLFNNPIYVVDLQNKYLATSSDPVPDNAFFREESASGYISERGIASIRANRLDSKVRDANSPYYYINELVQTGMLVDVVRIQGIEVGHIMMMESEQSFRDFDPDFFHRFSKLVSMELQKDSAYVRNKGVMYSYFLADLLKNPKHNIKDMQNRLELLGYKLKDSFYVIAIPPAAHATLDFQLEVILEHLKHIFPGSIYVIYEDTIVFLISKEMYHGFSEYELKQLDDYLAANHLKAGISNFFQQLEDTGRFYQQAVDAVHLGLKLKSADRICYYSDYYVYKMLEIYEKEDTEIRFLIHPGLMRLYYYDQEKGTEFMQTLQEYLIHPGQTSVVAANLHIHKNTLLYRLGKIKEITDCELAVGEDYMNMNLSLMIMRYLSML